MKRKIAVLLAMVGVALRATYGQVGSAPFVQDPLPDGLVTIEAENFHTSTVVNGKAWLVVTNGVYSGGRAVQAMPNTGTNINTGFAVTSPRLEYRVQFNRTGPHVVTLRGVGITTADDSVHAGINNAANTTSDRIFGFDGTPRWSASTLDGPVAIINVPSVGQHTVTVWMREDGFILDKISVSSNTNFLPAKLGPPESDHVGQTNSAAASPMSTWITSAAISNGNLVVGFDPLPDVDTYVAGASSNLNGGAMTGAVSTMNGYSIATPLAGGESRFIGVGALPVQSNLAAAVNALNRISYGATPDELLRVATGPTPIGAAAYIAEQLAPEAITETADANVDVLDAQKKITSMLAESYDLQRWHILRAVHGKRQLLETLLQFYDNHFNTYYWKSRWVLDSMGPSYTEAGYIAAEMEYREMQAWRQVLLNPNGTFGDLLKISAESPAMIIYLDTLGSVAGAPNENYSREILELFCFGVDNGYDQSDIVAMAPAWTGWRVARVRGSDLANPHAIANTNPVVLIPRQATGWRYRKGTSEPPAGWMNNGFTEGAEWLTGQASIGYGDGDDNTVLTDMSNSYSTVYLRKTFVVTNLADITTLRLGLYYDDGMIVYLNGTEITRQRAPTGTVAYNRFASSSSAEPTAWLTIGTTGAASLVVSGTNVLAIHGLNRTIANNDVSMDAELMAMPAWGFVFDPAVHEMTNKVIFAGKKIDARFGPPYAGQSYQLNIPIRSGTNGIQDGYDICTHLANLPYTQEFLSAKLCQLLVHDDFTTGGYYNQSKLTPEEALIKACMTAWDTPSGDGRKGNIRAVVSTILNSDLFKSRSVLRQKVKTPFEYTVSAIRALRADLGGGLYSASTDGYDLIDPMWRAGMELFARDTPDGWPEVARKWIDTGTLVERLRFVENFVMKTTDPLKAEDYGSGGAQNISDPVALLMNRLPSGQWTDPVAVVQYFAGILFPAEGLANLDLDIDEAVNILNSDDTGAAGTSPFNVLVPGTSQYDDRVRSMVGFLLSNPKFHEQ